MALDTASPPNRRRHRARTTSAGWSSPAPLALVVGAAAGGLIGGLHPTSVGTATATSKTMLSTSQIASRVDPGLVDVVSTLGDEQATAAGTGIVLTSNGEILTNNHVIDGATSIKVTDVGNGRTYTAKVVGYDASQDVAVIQLQNASGLTVASLGDSSTVRTGDNVVALGNAGRQGRHSVGRRGHGHRPEPVDHRVGRGVREQRAADRADRDQRGHPAGRLGRFAGQLLRPGDRHGHRGLLGDPAPVPVRPDRGAGLRDPDQRGDLHRQADRGRQRLG